MTKLLEIKEKIVRFYGNNESYLKPVVKLLLAYAVFSTINGSIGYMSRISSTPITLILSLVCSILPNGATVFLAAVVTLLHLFALSWEVGVVALLLFLIIFFIYFRFAPKHGYEILLVPLCFKMHIPYVMPLGQGLLRELYAVFSLMCGTVVYFFLSGVRENEAVLGSVSEESEGFGAKITVAINQLISNKEMYLVLGIFFLTMVIVSVIRKMSIENAWTIAIISGTLFQIIGLIAGYVLLGIPGKNVSVLVGNIISCAVAFILQFLFFNLDYSRTERLQFEDDEYYYYVKAVPKSVVSGANKQVKRFSGKEERVGRLTKEQFAKEMDIDQDLLD